MKITSKPDADCANKRSGHDQNAKIEEKLLRDKAGVNKIKVNSKLDDRFRKRSELGEDFKKKKDWQDVVRAQRATREKGNPDVLRFLL